jgi:hypothetical protein
VSEKEPTINAEETLTVAQAFLAMRVFLYRFHERGDLGADALPSILRWTSLRDWTQPARGHDPVTADPAQWFDWVHAVKEAFAGFDPDDAAASRQAEVDPS